VGHDGSDKNGSVNGAAFAKALCTGYPLMTTHDSAFGLAAPTFGFDVRGM